MPKRQKHMRDFQKPDLATTLDALKQGEDGKLNATIFYGLSDLAEAEVERVKLVWKNLIPSYRRRIVRRMVDVSETDFEMDYRAMGMLTLEDDDPGVREASIELLWEDESLELMRRLISIAQQDESREVRAAAASALGRFILLGELGDLPESETEQAQDAAVRLLTDPQEDVDVRRRALEAIANSSHTIVDGAIREAYASSDQRMRVSALFAMGRTCDDQWGDVVVRELEGDNAEMRYEAARAAGELELRAAVPQLVKLAVDGKDREIREMAIWSLGEIGGRDAMKALNLLVRKARSDGDDELLEALEDAIASASLIDGDNPDLMRINP